MYLFKLIVIFFFPLFFLHSFISAQINVEQYNLENGMSIYLNPDYSIPYVLGAIVVKGGSKYDPKDATGTAHFMEHMMFKGTQDIGTRDYKSEKVFLDSIKMYYNKISETDNCEQQLEFHLKINDLTQKASKYVIVDELDNLLEDIGSVDINAYTSNDAIVYHNVFPSHQISKWLELYSHRFENPVFRMFQHELEVVYEEKNMSLDDPFSKFNEEYNKRMYKNHPYGQQDILGSIEHLKKPLITKLEEYVDCFYVPNNMAIIICGNFSPREIKAKIELEFGTWKKKDIPIVQKAEETDFSKNEIYKIKSTPIRIGALGFRSVPMLHADENKITICNYLLENDMGTGILDKLISTGKILDVIIYQNHYVDYGDITIEFSPNKKSSFKKSEKFLLGAINFLINGDFSTEQLESAKLYLKKEKLKNIEKIYDYYNSEEFEYGRLDLLSELYLCNKKWSEYTESINDIDNINKNDIVLTATKYFKKNHLAVFSEKGHIENIKLKKPPFSPIIMREDSLESDFAKKFRNDIELEANTNYVDFQHDIIKKEISPMLMLYHSNSEINDLFKIKYKIGIGNKLKPELNYLANYMNSCGTEEFPQNNFYQKLEEFGISINVNCTEYFFEITLDGLNQNIEKAVEFAENLLKNTYINEQLLKNLVDIEIYNKEYFQNEPASIGSALLSFALYNKNSPYLKQFTNKELYNLNQNDVRKWIHEVNQYQCNIHYSGNLSVDTVLNIIKKYSTSGRNTKLNVPIYTKINEISENTIFFIDDPTTIQSQLYLFIQGEFNDTTEQAISDIFTIYFDKKIYNEIRNFHSLAYYSYFSFKNEINKFAPGYSLAYLSTQNDKTTDAISLLLNTVFGGNVNDNEINNIKNRLLQSLTCKTINRRTISEYIEWFELQNRKKDPMIYKTETYQQSNADDIYSFYEKNIRNKNYIISIVGDKNQIDFKKLSNWGKIIELKKTDVFNQ
jgi:zinc protease